MQVREKYIIIKMRISLICALGLLIGGVAAAGNKTLTFNAKGKFKMVQFTDIHFGEGDETDAQNQKLITDILEQENPDFVIISGDVVSGYAWDGKTKPWAAVQYAKMV
jgi:predicted MPP superfamily phosphohydrolase